MALSAMSTTTRPANTSLIPSAFMAGCNASTNQSDTKDAPTPTPPSTTNVSGIGQEVGYTSVPSAGYDCFIPFDGKGKACNIRASPATMLIMMAPAIVMISFFDINDLFEIDTHFKILNSRDMEGNFCFIIFRIGLLLLLHQIPPIPFWHVPNMQLHIFTGLYVYAAEILFP